MELNFKDMGLCDYKTTWNYQQEVHKMVKAAKLQSRKPTHKHEIIFVEHPHVYTLGKRGKEQNLLVQESHLEQVGAKLYKIDRGGDITYHGPGQVVCYPIIDLDYFKLGVRAYVHLLEEAVIQSLADFSITAERKKGATGVWIDVGSASKERKICAIGVKVSRSVTMHGLALNVNTDNSFFQHINPCGFSSKGVTSMQQELDTAVDMHALVKKLKKSLSLLMLPV